MSEVQAGDVRDFTELNNRRDPARNPHAGGIIDFVNNGNIRIAHQGYQWQTDEIVRIPEREQGGRFAQLRQRLSDLNDAEPEAPTTVVSARSVPPVENMIHAAHARFGGRSHHFPGIPNDEFPLLSSALTNTQRIELTELVFHDLMRERGIAIAASSVQEFTRHMSVSGRNLVRVDHNDIYRRLLREQHDQIERALNYAEPRTGEPRMLSGRAYVARVACIPAHELRPVLFFARGREPRLTQTPAFDHEGIDYRIDCAFAVQWSIR